MATEENIDRITPQYDGKTVFITGVSGFVGKALLEKFLRTTNVKKIYVLLRFKRGKSPAERINDIFNNFLFTTLLSQKPDAVKKCVPILGDVSEVDLGISKEHRRLLTEEVEFIYHSAATTKFDDSMKYAVTVNTRGTKYMLELAEQCKKLMLFIHVSSAYIFPEEKRALEIQYKSALNPHDVLKSLHLMQEDGNDQVSKKLLGDSPNTYTFSKALAENLVYEKVGKLPLIICRLALVIPSYQDPIPGWFNNLQGPMGLFVAGGKGVIRCVYMDCKSYANMIPVDACVSGLLGFGFYYLNEPDAPYIYNVCVPEVDIKKTWEEIKILAEDIIEKQVPFNGILWYPGGTMTKSKLYANFCFVMFQLIPAIFIDMILFVLGYKPILYNIQKRILKGMEMFEFYTNRPWDFETKNIETVRELSTEVERKNYVMKIERIDINKYLVDCMMACRRHILKETDDMLPAARRNMKIMYVLDRFCKISFFVLLGYFLYNFLCKCFLN